jgi:hypothetical protein
VPAAEEPTAEPRGSGAHRWIRYRRHGKIDRDPHATASWRGLQQAVAAAFVGAVAGAQHPLSTFTGAGAQHPLSTFTGAGAQHPLSTFAGAGAQDPASTFAGAGAQHPASTFAGAGAQQALSTFGGAEAQHPGATTAGSGAQHDPSPSRPRRAGGALHTPVSGNSSSTRAAAAWSPARAAAMERTCSWPVASRKVGARP